MIAETPIAASEVMIQFRAANDAIVQWQEAQALIANAVYKRLQAAGDRALDAGTNIDTAAILAELPTVPTFADFVAFLGEQGYEIGAMAGGGAEPRVFAQASTWEVRTLDREWESR